MAGSCYSYICMHSIPLVGQHVDAGHPVYLHVGVSSPVCMCTCTCMRVCSTMHYMYSLYVLLLFVVGVVDWLMTWLLPRGTSLYIALLK